MEHRRIDVHQHLVPRRLPALRIILAHAGGFVPYASHRLAAALAAETGRSPFQILDDFASFCFDTALSSGPAALPSLLAFAKPGHVLFGSDWPFAPEIAVSWFAGSLDASSSTTRRVPVSIATTPPLSFPAS